MANSEVVFDDLGSKQPKKWKSGERLINFLFEVRDEENLSLFKLNKIDMTESVLITVESVKFKTITESKEEEESKVDKMTQKEKLN